MAGHRKRKEILPTGGKFKGETGIDLSETIKEAQTLTAIELVPTSVTKEIEQQRQQIQEKGDMPADISIDQIAGGGADLKLQNAAAKHFPDLALEKLGAGDFFPGVRPVQEVGSVSGRIIGRQPIFVASGGLFPFGITEARKRALESAAQVKLAAQAAVLQGGPTTKPQYKRQLDSMWFDFVNEQGRKRNWDFMAVKSDPEFVEGATSFFTLGKEIEFAVDTAEGILDDEVNKEKFVPDDVGEFASDIFSGQLSLEDALANPDKFLKKMKTLKSYVNLTNVIRTEVMPLLQDSINEVIDGMDPEAIKIIRSTNDYDLIAKTIRASIDEDVLVGWAGYIKEDFGVAQSIDEIGNRVLKIFGGSIKQTITLGRKFNLAGARSLRKKEPKVIPSEVGRVNFTDKVIKDGIPTGEESIVPLEAVDQFNFAGTSSQPKGINVTPNIFINPITDKKEKVVGVINADVVKSVTFMVDPARNNKIVFQKGTGDIPQNTKGLKQERFAIIKANEDNDAMGIEKGETRIVPFESVRQPLINAGIKLEGNTFVVEGEDIGDADVLKDIFPTE